MPPSLRKWIDSLWRGLTSTSNWVQIIAHLTFNASLMFASTKFNIATTLIHYYHALLSRSKAAPRIGSARDLSPRDLSPLYEAFSEDDDEYGNPIFLYSSFGYITEDYIVYFGKSRLRKYHLTAEEIRDSLQRLPDEDVYPIAPWNITKSIILSEDIFLKGPKLHTDFIGTGLLPKLILQEAEIFELLLRNPHPNIVRYHGCLIKRGRIVGIILDRYPITLKQRLENGHLDTEKCMSQLTSAVSHLHSLELAHNDLTPMNIMIDEHDTPVIIDFGSCQPFGCKLITAGTPGWIDQDFALSAQHHDEYALGKIRTWLETQEREGG